MDKIIHPAFDLLGRDVQDIVSGQHGIVDCISFDLYGSIHASFAVNNDPQRWYDVKRLKVINQIPCPPSPDFSAYPPLRFQ